MGVRDWTILKGVYQRTYNLHKSITVLATTTGTLVDLEGAGDILSLCLYTSHPQALSTNLVSIIIDGQSIHSHSWSTWQSYFGTCEHGMFVVVNNNPGVILSGILIPNIPFTDTFLLNYTNASANDITVACDGIVGIYP